MGPPWQGVGGKGDTLNKPPSGPASFPPDIDHTTLETGIKNISLQDTRHTRRSQTPSLLETEGMEILSITNLIHRSLFILNIVLSGGKGVIPLGK